MALHVRIAPLNNLEWRKILRALDCEWGDAADRAGASAPPALLQVALAYCFPCPVGVGGVVSRLLYSEQPV